jgi:hypothetical protein
VHHAADAQSTIFFNLVMSVIGSFQTSIRMRGIGARGRAWLAAKSICSAHLYRRFYLPEDGLSASLAWLLSSSPSAVTYLINRSARRGCSTAARRRMTYGRKNREQKPVACSGVSTDRRHLNRVVVYGLLVG